jgi:hypothetical protein
MLKDAREVYFFDAKLQSWSRNYPKGLNPLPHHELAKAIESMFSAGLAEYNFQGLQYIYVSDITVRADRCELLLGFSDKTAADPTLNDRPKKRRRVVQKVGDEGIEHSAHVVWAYGTKTNTGNCAFLLERATHLASGAVTTFLNRLLRIHGQTNKSFKLPDPSGHMTDGKPTMLDVRPSIELLGHPSQEFLEDLKKGQMTGLELYTEESAGKQWDANAYALEQRRGVLIKPNADKALPKAKAFLDGILNKQVKSDYELARVAFKTDSDVDRTVTIFTENSRLVNDNGYVRKERIDLSQHAGLPNAFDSLQTAIVNKMRALL